MKIGDFLDLIYRDKRIRQRATATQKFAVAIAISVAVGAGITGILITLKPAKKSLRNLRNLSKGAVNTMDIIKDIVEHKARAAQVAAAHIAKEAGDTVNDVHGEITDVQKDIVDGYHDVKQDIHKTVAKIADRVR